MKRENHSKHSVGGGSSNEKHHHRKKRIKIDDNKNDNVRDECCIQYKTGDCYCSFIEKKKLNIANNFIKHTKKVIISSVYDNNVDDNNDVSDKNEKRKGNEDEKLKKTEKYRNDS